MKPDPSLRRVAPFTYEIAFEAIIDPEIHDEVIRCRADLANAAIPGIDDLFITYHSVGIRIGATHPPDIETRLQSWLDAWIRTKPGSTAKPANLPTHVIPVRFGGEDGIDLADVAAFARIPESDVIKRFCEIEYRVYMTGFIGGFPYLGTVPTAIGKPRLAKPRNRVPAGSVGIASDQAGIYPVETPGGWNLIGRTEVDIPSLNIQPGDRIRFRGINHD